jgi:anti-sigma factor RsiW
MVDLRGFSLPEQHLLPDAVVAFVDGELSPVARQRAAAHLGRCAACAAELATQRQASTAVRTAAAPGMPAGLLAALRNIPSDTDLPSGPEHLAVTPDGQLVAVQRPDRVAGLGSGAVLGSSTPLGRGGGFGANTALGGAALGEPRAWFGGRRGVQGAGVVAAGLMIGALAVVGSHALSGADLPSGPVTAHGGTGGAQVVEANFAVGGDVQNAVQSPAGVRADQPATSTTAPSTVASGR